MNNGEWCSRATRDTILKRKVNHKLNQYQHKFMYMNFFSDMNIQNLSESKINVVQKSLIQINLRHEFTKCILSQIKEAMHTSVLDYLDLRSHSKVS